MKLQEAPRPVRRDVQWPAKYDVFGLKVSRVDYDQAVRCIIEAAKHRQAAIVSCHAVHAVMSMIEDPVLLEQANRFAMITPDGQPVRWALNLLHKAGLEKRVYGPELMKRTLQAAAENEIPVFLYGGTPESLQLLTEQLSEEIPDLEIAGGYSPPFRELSDQELCEIADQINASGAGIVFIGLGCPKQDRFAALQASRIQGVQICVGAAFDFHAKTKPVAPAWMQDRGLEWVFRLSCEPKRLWKRYLFTNSKFVMLLAKYRLLGSSG